MVKQTIGGSLFRWWSIPAFLPHSDNLNNHFCACEQHINIFKTPSNKNKYEIQPYLKEKVLLKELLKKAKIST